MDSQPERSRARQLFDELQSLSAADREAALERARTHDAALAAEVVRLLAAHDRAGSFLERGAAAAFAAPSLLGRTLGPYQLTALLGIGGMGEVYRARDLVLRREVAVKTLSPQFAADAERLARLRREAQILASLDHVNVAGIHGLDESHGALLLVMELIDGPTLAGRLERGALPVAEALPIARQITDALSAAHARGIVHRDLKTANIKLRPDGVVKVLDFGLAKISESAASELDASLTRAGMILGTARCMSPEQARGRPIDRRTDIWAFGCVLYEMLTGRPAFDGEDVASTLAAILKAEPDWSALPPDTPVAIRRALRRCLEKNHAHRLADIADVRLELDETDAPVATVAGSVRSAKWRKLIPWAAAVTAVAIAAWLVASRPTETSTASTAVYRTSLVLPERLGTQRNVYGNTLALSPDGARLVFVASDANSRTRLWLRHLDDLDARQLPETTDAQSPFWSPDGRWLAFVQNRQLRKIEVASGAIVTLSDDAMFGGAWSADGTILFTQLSGVLAAVPEAGGTAVPLKFLPNNASEAFNTQPFFLPGQRVFGYVSLGVGSVHTDLYLASLDAGVKPRRLPVEASVVQYARGYLWYLSGSTLNAHAFDAETGTLSGLPRPVAEKVRINMGPFRGGVFSVSPAGTLVYQRDLTPGYELTWFDRAGAVLGTLGSPADYADLQLSPDASRALVSIAPTSTGTRDLWIFDIARGLRSRFTFDETRSIRGPIWSPDGREVVFATERDGHIVLMRKSASGSTAPQVLLDDLYDKEPLSWSPDGCCLLFGRREHIASPEVWVLPLSAEAVPYRLPYPRARFAWFSPDGRWIAFVSGDIAARGELFIAPFPGPGAMTRISTLGAVNARWRADSKELLYISPSDNKLMSVTLSLGKDEVAVGEVKALFDLPWPGPRYTHDITPDGARILALTQRSPETAAPLTLLLNWPSLLQR